MESFQIGAPAIKIWWSQQLQGWGYLQFYFTKLKTLSDSILNLYQKDKDAKEQMIMVYTNNIYKTTNKSKNNIYPNKSTYKSMNNISSNNTV